MARSLECQVVALHVRVALLTHFMRLASFAAVRAVAMAQLLLGCSGV